MIALILLVGIAVWLVVALLLALWLPSLFGIKRNGWLASALLFPILVVLPIADELIGRWQFKALCEREAVIKLSPDWRNVKRAKKVRTQLHPENNILSTQGGRYDYIDIDSGKIFFSYSMFNRRGGILMRNISWDGGDRDFCKPEGLHETYKTLNVDELLKREK